MTYIWRNVTNRAVIMYPTAYQKISSKIVGRVSELKILDKLYHSTQAEFLAVYGRRRIGKTYLINEYFNDKGNYFELTGIKDATLNVQLNNFCQAFSDTFGPLSKNDEPLSWQQAFYVLRKRIEKIDPKEKVILFFDELPWLASPRSGFMQSMDHAWNRYFSRMPNVILIVCGSAASWMIKKVIYDKGGLHGRLTAQIHLEPFTLSETKQYLLSRGIDLDQREIIEIYLAFGGVAKYLSYIEKGQSSAELMYEHCFKKNGALYAEFEKLFSSLFENPQSYIDVIYQLSEHKKGMTQNQILSNLKLTPGGGFTKILNDLEASGFIQSIKEFNAKRKDKQYRLVDEYSLFYLKWILPIKSKLLKNISSEYWLSHVKSPAFYAWAGYAFEGLCLKHVDKICEALKLEAVALSASAFSVKNDDELKVKGAQIDLVIDRRDKCINLCEIKFTNDEFVVSKEYAKELRHKKERFKSAIKTRKSVFTKECSNNCVKSTRL